MTLLLLMYNEIPGIPPSHAHHLISCKVCSAICYRSKEPKYIEDGNHPGSHNAQVHSGKTRSLQVLQHKVMPMLYHGCQQTQFENVSWYVVMEEKCPVDKEVWEVVHCIPNSKNLANTAKFVPSILRQVITRPLPPQKVH